MPLWAFLIQSLVRCVKATYPISTINVPWPTFLGRLYIDACGTMWGDYTQGRWFLSTLEPRARLRVVCDWYSAVAFFQSQSGLGAPEHIAIGLVWGVESALWRSKWTILYSRFFGYLIHLNVTK